MKEYTNFQKLLLLIGLLQVSVEFMEDVMADPAFEKHFAREIKRSANNFIASSDQLITRISRGSSQEAKEQIVNLNKAIQAAVDLVVDLD